MGHLPCTAAVHDSLAGFSRVFLFRELRHAFVSLARFEISEEMDGEAAEAARASVGVPTLTWSGSRSALASHWDDRLEQWFRSEGGPELNRALGYPEAVG